MQEKEGREQRIHWIKYYEVGLSLYTVILAAVMIGIVLRIYLNGTSPSNLSEDGLYLQPVYSRELVAGYLRSLLPWFLLWGVAVIVGGILHSRMPARKEFVPVSPEETFDRLMQQIMRQSAGQPEDGGAEKSPNKGIWKWVDSLFERRSGLNASELLRKYEFTESDETRSVVESLRQEQKKWYYVNLACVFICGICLGVAGSYLLNREHFTSWDLEEVMGAMLRVVLPPLVVAFAALCARSEWKKKSLERMIPQLRELVTVGRKKIMTQKKSVAGQTTCKFETDGDKKADSVKDTYEMTECSETAESPDTGVMSQSETEAEPKPEYEFTSDSKYKPDPMFKSESPGSAKIFFGFSRLTISRLVIAVVAVIFLVVGVNNGGMRDVLVKAINICTECIGLG